MLKTKKIATLSRRIIALVLVAFLLDAPQLFAQVAGVTAAQAGAPKALQIVILDGEDALNNIRQRTAREPIIEVQDENHKPVAGALVLFTIKQGPKGAGGSFAGASTLAAITGLDGQAIAKGLLPNSVKGQYTISVQASVGGVTTTTVIAQANILGPAAASSIAAQGGTAVAHHIGLFGAHFWIVAGGIAAASGAIVTTVIVTHSSGTTITPGNGTVKP